MKVEVEVDPDPFLDNKPIVRSGKRRGTRNSEDRKKRKERKKVRLQCDQCEYKCFKQVSLQNHTESAHMGISHPCDQCDFAATSLDKLETHKARVYIFLFSLSTTVGLLDKLSCPVLSCPDLRGGGRIIFKLRIQKVERRE